MTAATQHGKTISMYLPSGSPDGLVFAEISNRTLKAARFPKNLAVQTLQERPELQKTGFYFLFGTDDTSASSKRVYIGETQELAKRIGTHLKKKDFWSETIVFFSKDDNMNAAHVKYIESRCCALAAAAGQYILENGTAPNLSKVSEAESDVLEEIIESVRLLLGIFGHQVLEPLLPKSVSCEESSLPASFETYQLLYAKKYAATHAAEIVKTAEGFVVKTGARLVDEIAKSAFQLITAKRS